METVNLPRDSSLLSAANKLPVEQRELIFWLLYLHDADVLNSKNRQIKNRTIYCAPIRIRCQSVRESAHQFFEVKKSQKNPC